MIDINGLLLLTGQDMNETFYVNKNMSEKDYMEYGEAANWYVLTKFRTFEHLLKRATEMMIKKSGVKTLDKTIKLVRPKAEKWTFKRLTTMVHYSGTNVHTGDMKYGFANLFRTLDVRTPGYKFPIIEFDIARGDKDWTRWLDKDIEPPGCHLVMDYTKILRIHCKRFDNVSVDFGGLTKTSKTIDGVIPSGVVSLIISYNAAKEIGDEVKVIN